MANHEAVNQLSDILLQSWYDYHFANHGAGYPLPKMMFRSGPK